MFVVHDEYVITLTTKVNIDGITISKSCLNKVEAVQANLVLGLSLFSVFFFFFFFFDVFPLSLTLLVYDVIHILMSEVKIV